LHKPVAFGRRAPTQFALPARVRRKAPSASAALTASDRARPDAFEAEPALPPLREPNPVDAELEEWKRTHKKLPLFAWRPLYFMASLCFGLASFVLPDSINDIVQWPLYALAAMSFYLGMKMRRAKREARLEAEKQM